MSEFTREEVEKKVLAVIARCEPGAEKYGLRGLLVEDLNFDPLDAVEVLLHLEDEFHVSLEDDSVPERVEGYVNMVLAALSKRE